MRTSGTTIVLAAAGNVGTTSSWRCSSARTKRRSATAGASRVRKPARVNGTPGIRFQRKDTEQYHVCLGAPGISRLDERRFAASLLDAILGGSASSRLFQEIREKRGMAYSVYSYSSQYTDTGQIGVYVGTREDNLAECLEIAVERARGHRGGQRARPTSSRGRRRTSRAGSCSRSSRPRTG